MKISSILKSRADWLSAEGGYHPIVISSRVRLARNLAKLPFPGWAKKTERVRILDEIKPDVDNLPQMRGSFSEQLNELSAMEKQVLVERHLISREHAAKGMGSAVAINSYQTVSIMMNEEDHLRMQAMTAGLDLQKTFRVIDEVDTALEAHLDFAFDPELGYFSPARSGLKRADKPGNQLDQQNRPGGAGVVWRRHRGNGQSFPGLEPNHTRRERESNYRTPEQSDRDIDPAGKPGSRKSARNKTHDALGSGWPSVRHFDSRIFDFLKGSIKLAVSDAPGD
jgi:hypothetical protein